MADPALPPDFSEFLRLLNAHHVSYLVVGGYAVGFHGYPRATADIAAGRHQDLADLEHLPWGDPQEARVEGLRAQRLGQDLAGP